MLVRRQAEGFSLVLAELACKACLCTIELLRPVLSLLKGPTRQECSSAVYICKLVLWHESFLGQQGNLPLHHDLSLQKDCM